MNMERKRDPGEEGTDPDGKDLMKSTLIALGWEESQDDAPPAPVDDKEEKIKSLSMEVESLRQLLAEKDAIIESSRQARAALEAEVLALQDNVARLDEGKNTIEAAATARVSQLERELESLKAQQAVPPSQVVNAPAGVEGIEDLERKLAVKEEANAVLERKCKDLAEQLSELESAPPRVAPEEMAVARQRIESLEGTIREKDVFIEASAGKLEELHDEIQELKQQIVDVIGENARFRGAVNEKDEQLAGMQGKIDSFKTQEGLLNAELTKMQLALDTLKAENEEQSFQIKEYERVINDQKHELLQSVSDTSDSLGRLQQMIEDKDARLAELETRHSSLASRFESLKEKNELIEKDRFGTQAILDKVNRELEEFREKFYLQKNIIKKLEVQIDDLKNSNNFLSRQAGQKEDMQADMDRVKKEFDATVNTLHKELDKVRAENEALQRTVKEQQGIGLATSTLEETIKEKAAIIERLEGALKEKHDEIQALHGRLDTLASERDARVADRETLDREVVTLRSKLADLETELEKISNVDEELLKDAEKKEAFYQEKIEELERALGDALESTMDLSSSASELDKLKADLERKDKEIEKYKRRVDEMPQLETAKAALEEEIKTLKISLKDMRRRLGKYEQA